MSTAKAIEWHQRPDEAAEPIRKVLIADDSRAQRGLLRRMLAREGYEVREAASGLEALEMCREIDFDLIVSDWVMPGMNGLDFCQAFRSLERASYGYFILLTSNTEKDAVARGLDIGADDFVSKPVSAPELRARLRAGERILAMQEELGRKNQVISETLSQLQEVHDRLDRDLINARKMQLGLLRETHLALDTAQLWLMLKPSGHVGGDLVGFFHAGNGRLAIYAIDVSGHGVTSALLTARLASYLSDAAPAQNIALRPSGSQGYAGRPPDEVAERLNDLMLAEMGSDLYFTMVFGYLDLASGVFDFVQCGHPAPILIGADGPARYVGAPGLPVGLIEGAAYERRQIELSPTDRLLLYSDGFPECARRDGSLLGEDDFLAMVGELSDLEGGELFEGLVWSLDMLSDASDFDDDLSCALISFEGA